MRANYGYLRKGKPHKILVRILLYTILPMNNSEGNQPSLGDWPLPVQSNANPVTSYPLMLMTVACRVSISSNYCWLMVAHALFSQLVWNRCVRISQLYCSYAEYCNGGILITWIVADHWLLLPDFWLLLRYVADQQMWIKSKKSKKESSRLMLLTLATRTLLWKIKLIMAN
jgi:hypothetical protein